nr:MAG TPA: hypothetical protein [Caudoviricetes sp.]
MVKTAIFAKDVRCLLENRPFLPKTLGIKKYRQLDADGGELSYKFMKARD